MRCLAVIVALLAVYVPCLSCGTAEIYTRLSTLISVALIKPVWPVLLR